MREIKFRARLGEGETWFYFTLGDLVCGSTKMPPFNKNAVWQDWCEFTGLHDKNGKEIFEDDICKREHQKGEDVGCIYFANGCFWYSPIDSSERIAVGVLSPSYIGTFEIIGDIYENPELLTTPTN